MRSALLWVFRRGDNDKVVFIGEAALEKCPVEAIGDDGLTAQSTVMA